MPDINACESCGKAFERKARGRPRRFCSTECSRAKPIPAPEIANPDVEAIKVPVKALIDVKRDALFETMKRVLAREGREPLRADIDNAPEQVIDHLLKFYGSDSPQALVW